ncbi:MAG: hypothetical protein WD733_16335, partial [Bryobacterales bacterium]
MYQRLKELNPVTFEKLCFQLLKERHPAAKIRAVEGASGDEGADLFLGDLENGPTIWQVKAFSNGFKDSQKGQIRQSLKHAVRNLAPRRWILCLNIDMDIRVHRWFQRLVRSYADKVEIGLWDASHIINELAHRKSIRNLFFPGAALEVSELRSLVTGIANHSAEQLAALATENAEQLIERLKECDARFNYEVSITTDRPSTLPSNVAVSLTVGASSIHAYPRDIEALRQSPPKLELELNPAGHRKVLAIQQTGHSQILVQSPGLNPPPFRRSAF